MQSDLSFICLCKHGVVFTTSCCMQHCSDIALIDSLFVKAIRSADIADSVDTKKTTRAMSACAVFIESIDNNLLVIAGTAPLYYCACLVTH